MSYIYAFNMEVYCMDTRKDIIKYINENTIYHSFIFDYLKNNNIPYTENKNGYFFNIELLSDQDISIIVSVFNTEISPLAE